MYEFEVEQERVTSGTVKKGVAADVPNASQFQKGFVSVAFSRVPVSADGKLVSNFLLISISFLLAKPAPAENSEIFLK